MAAQKCVGEFAANLDKNFGLQLNTVLWSVALCYVLQTCCIGGRMFLPRVTNIQCAQ